MNDMSGIIAVLIDSGRPDEGNQSKEVEDKLLYALSKSKRSIFDGNSFVVADLSEPLFVYQDSRLKRGGCIGI